jgi:3-deoxy-D-manno-octulosonate 8-phosphate phosphatase (KDO 8-P phosphatase)
VKSLLADRMRDIEVLVLDVDGVLTDGTVIYSDAGQELQAFHVRDGSGLSLWRKAGKRSAIVTGRGSKALERRAAELGIDPVMLRVTDKAAAFADVLKKLAVAPERVGVVADDLPDLPMMRRAGVAFAVGDAALEVHAAADLTTSLVGGRGAVREAIEWLLKAQDRWDKLVRGYA